MVVDTDKDVTLHRSLMAPDLARALSAVFEEEGHAVLALQDRATANGVDYVVTEAVPLDESTSRWMSITAARVERYPRLSDHPHDHAMRVGIVAALSESRRVRDRLLREFGDRIVCHSLYVPAYDVEVLEVFDPAVNKWEGLLHVADAESIRPRIIAIGDDMNDVPMLEQAGLGVAMGNARPEAMAAADRSSAATPTRAWPSFWNNPSRHARTPRDSKFLSRSSGRGQKCPRLSIAGLPSSVGQTRWRAGGKKRVPAREAGPGMTPKGDATPARKRGVADANHSALRRSTVIRLQSGGGWRAADKEEGG